MPYECTAVKDNMHGTIVAAPRLRYVTGVRPLYVGRH